MVRWTRSAMIAPGKFTQAIQFAKEITEFIKKYKGVPPISVFIDSFGEMTTIRWFADYENLAALEKVGDQMFMDLEYLQKIEKAGELFMQGTINDTVMRGI